MIYQQLTSHDRYIMAALRKQGPSIQQITDHLGRHRSTLYREFARNRCGHIDGAYRPNKAQRRTVARRRRSRRNRQYGEADFLLIRTLLRKKWSSEQIVGFIRRVNLMKRRLSHETLYQYIWRDKARGGYWWAHLRPSPRHRRKRYKAYDSRGRLADKRPITQRPASVETRQTPGHWEINTVMGTGSPDGIVTLVERKTGFVHMGKLADRTSAMLNQKTLMLIRRTPTAVKTITADNGTEFHQYQKIEEKSRTMFYVANPYHSWEKEAAMKTATA